MFLTKKDLRFLFGSSTTRGVGEIWTLTFWVKGMPKSVKLRSSWWKIVLHGDIDTQTIEIKKFKYKSETETKVGKHKQGNNLATSSENPSI